MHYQQKIIYCDSWTITEGKEVEGVFIYARSELNNKTDGILRALRWVTHSRWTREFNVANSTLRISAYFRHLIFNLFPRRLSLSLAVIEWLNLFHI